MIRATIFIVMFSITSHAQFRLVKDIYPNNSNSNPVGLKVFNGRLFFGAINPLTDLQTIYVSDGTNQGTFPITLNSTAQFATATTYTPEFFQFNSELYFSARTPTIDINSSVSSVVKVTGINNTTSSVNPLSVITGSINSSFSNAVLLNNKIVFNPINAQNYLGGIEPYVIDFNNASNSGLLKDINILANSNPSEFTLFNNLIYFAATDLSGNRDLYKTNGLTSGTSVFLNATNSFSNVSPHNLNVLGNDLIFAASTAQYGTGIYKTNGNSGNWNFLAFAAYSEHFKVIDSILYFSATNGINGKEIWRSDGTAAGTYIVKDIYIGGDSNPKYFTKVGNDIFFVASGYNNSTGQLGAEIWKTDGTQFGTVMVKDLNTNGSSDPNFLTSYNGKLYFSANDGIHGRQLWVSDGTESGTQILVLNLGSVGSNNSYLTVVNDELFFSANSGNGEGQELWAYKDPALSTNQFTLNENAITISPNPTKNYFELSSEIKLEKVEVFSLQGQLVKTFEPQTQYNVSELAKGIYIVKINTGEDSVSKKISID